MGAYPWGGHSNGLILPRELTQLRAEPGDYMRSDAARQFDALATEFRAYFGRGLVVLEAYRSLAEQRRLRDGWLRRLPGFNPAAVPGTSVHGWGLAVDLASGVNRFGSAEHNWMLIVAQRYGFDNWRGRADGEAWHWEYGNIRPTIEVAFDGATPIDNTDSPEPQLPEAIKKKDEDMYINGVGGTDYFFTPLGDVPITSVEDHAMLTRFLEGNDKFNQAQKDDINSYIFRAGQQFREALVKSIGSASTVSDAPTTDEIWDAKVVMRGGEMIAIKQEVADAHTYARRAAASAAALQASITSVSSGNVDPKVIQEAARAGAAEALEGLEATVSVELERPEQDA